MLVRALVAQRRVRYGYAVKASQSRYVTTARIGGRDVTFVCHKAILSGTLPGNRFAALRECFESSAVRLEVDVHSLTGGDYIVFHERRLETETDGAGSIGGATADGVRALRYTHDPDDRPPLLSEMIAMAAGCDTELQLDLKDWRPLPAVRLRALLDVIAPVHDRVIISCGQDWNLRRLHTADPTLAIGFDPGHYFDFKAEGAPAFLPRATGAYGYRDDHPLSVGRTEDVGDYLHERFEILLEQVPGVREFFLNFRMILRMLDDGFDVAAWLHERDVELTAWTPDYQGADSMASIERLVAAGVDRITTNTIPAWMAAFEDAAGGDASRPVA
jgi:glycerophosphoryl diester phosphodiesterase